MNKTPDEILNLPLSENKYGASNIREYLICLLYHFWEGGDGVSSWELDIYEPMVKSGIICGIIDEDEYYWEIDTKTGKQLVLSAIAHLGGLYMENRV